jgi:glycosyltransferase involved in cell wall biosynthesis
MLIGIDASRAFQKNKTGIEEYSFQVLKYLRNYLGEHQVILYLDPRVNKKEYIGFDLPKNWKIKFLRAPIFWTQIRLSLEMIFNPVDALFVPAHTVPLIHPKNTIVTIHGLEYEFCPQAYAFWGRFYMRWSIRNSCRWAKKIIAVSGNTKKDLQKFYGVPEGKIGVIHEGYENKNTYSKLKYKILLFVGRLEERKNICGIIDAFGVLKEKYGIDHKLVLVGKFGYGEEGIRNKIENCKYKKDIILPGYVPDKEKFELLENADVFMFPTFYEGFGLPILEAQSAGTPVVTSDISSMPEVAGEGAALVDPNDTNAIAEAVNKFISDESYKNDIIEKGLENVKRFSWDKCAEEIAELLLK